MSTTNAAPSDSTPIRGSILGTRVQRTEDPALLRGARRYLADLPLVDRLHAVFVRSEIAHGVLGDVHVDEARAMPGVVEVLTAAELGVAPHHGFAPVHPDFKRAPLAVDRVRFVGEPIAVILAETFAQGVDAAQTVWADIEPLEALVTPLDAFAEGAPDIFESHGSNEASVHVADEPVVFGADEHVMRGTYVNQRMAVVPMEPDCAAAEVDSGTGRVTLWVSNQMPHLVHTQFCSALGLETKNVRVVTPQVGGGFGGKAGLHSEYTVVGACAIRTGRPVQWMPTRSEDMVALPHSRGQVQHVELGCRPDGTFTGLRVHLLGDGGSYPTVGAYLPGGTRRMAQGTYAFDAIQCDIAVAVTNTTSMGAYRGAGRPEATAMLERAVDQAALELGIDPIELRKRNLLGDDVFPFTTLTGNTYDSGRYAVPLDRAAEVVGYETLRAEQVERRAADDRSLLGIGVASYVEITAGGGPTEFGAVDVHPDGSATVHAGTQNHGQGHQTAFAMLVSDQTGIPVDRIALVDGDTDAVRTGGGTGGSRSLQLGGSAVRGATEVMVERAKSVAARMLEADEADIVVDTLAGTIGVAGVPAQALTWGEVAAGAEEAGDELHGDFDFVQDGATFPFGAHIAVVEVDRDTGYVTLLRHIAVDDCGTVLNPLLVEGQQHGGVAAGIGQALWEDVAFDEDGNPITSNMADYGIPTAAELPMFEVVSTETPTPLNPLGAKGIGEAATIGSTPAVQNAVIDAVSHLGIRHIDLPCTPQRVWSAIRDAESGTLADPWSDPPPIFATLRERVAAGAELVEDDDAAAAADGI
ncbi:xanthine dehydrogenase family protein molybdopterin-binding subunit [Ilumatobacter sp.]|uniref:xanthine dehydrogenase family protein molybdopterin-binding subunit n=1 Tax=Ilumatobacter sp. TaxID=1967498 RepID=UPI003C41C848